MEALSEARARALTAMNKALTDAGGDKALNASVAEARKRIAAFDAALPAAYKQHLAPEDEHP